MFKLSVCQKVHVTGTDCTAWWVHKVAILLVGVLQKMENANKNNKKQTIKACEVFSRYPLSSNSSLYNYRITLRTLCWSLNSSGVSITKQLF